MKFQGCRSFFITIFFLLSFFDIQFSNATQITALANGTSTPQTTANQNQVIQNGDFQIFRTNPLPNGNAGFLIGDGINDFTRWILDFPQDTSFPIFAQMAQLTAADLLIKLIPKNQDFSSDFVRIDSLPNINISSLVPNFIVNTQIEFSINLLQSYSSNAILALFKAGAVSLMMRYEDDAIVTPARLSLSKSLTPAPDLETY